MKRFVIASILTSSFATSTFALVSFATTPLQVSPAGAQVRVAVGDVDADGRNELVVVRASSDAPLGIYSIAANGNATLEHSVPLMAHPGPSWSYVQPRILDVDGDGDRDIALYLRTGGQSGLLQLVKWEQSSSSFSVSGPFSTPESDAAFGFDVGDIDGDGIADAITANHGLHAPQGIFVASGASGFSSFTSYPFPFNGAPGVFGPNQRGIIQVYARDLDADGRVDVAVSTAPYNSVAGRIFWNRAGFGLSQTQDIAGGASIELGIGDQSGDGRADIIATGDRAPDIRIYRGPQFTSTSLLRVPPDPRTPLIGDFTGDGRADIALSMTFNKNVMIIAAGSQGQVLVNSADLAAADFLVDDYVQELAAGDVDNDGRLDLLFATDRVILIRLAGDTVPPLLTLPADIVAEATSPAGAIVTFTATAVDPGNGAVAVKCMPPSGSQFAIGTRNVSCNAVDGGGNSATGSFKVMVRDTTPPLVTSVSATPSVLGPPNHKMIPVTVRVNATDRADAAPVARIVRVTSNEPENGTGDGDTGPDWEITGPLTVKLRAERSGKGTGRIYTLALEVSDASGNKTSSTARVTVGR